MALWADANRHNRDVSVDIFKNDHFIVKEKIKTRLFEESCSINRFVVNQCTHNLLMKLFENLQPDSLLYSVNTDSFTITNPKNSYPNKNDVPFKTKNIGNLYIVNSPHEYFETHFRENIHAQDYPKIQPDENNHNTIFHGCAGSGKTTKLVQMAKQAKKPLILSTTNMAVQNIRNKLENEGLSYLVKNCHTFDSYFNEWTGRSWSE